MTPTLELPCGVPVASLRPGQWESLRQSGIGSSEAAGAIGVSPYDDDTPLSNYLRKLGLAPPRETNLAMRIGQLAEPMLATLYQDRTGADFAGEQFFCRSSAHHFMTATLDRLRTDGRIVELKTAGGRSASLWGEEGTDEIPPNYLVQVTHQMIVAGADVVDVAVLIGGADFSIYTVEFDDRVAARLVELEAEFWRCVQAQEPPEIDPQRDSRNLAYLYPEPGPDIEFDAEETALVERWEQHKAAKNLAEKEADKLRAAILAAVKDAGRIRLADGRMLTRKIVERKETIQKACKYCDLRIRSERGR